MVQNLCASHSGLHCLGFTAEPLICLDELFLPRIYLRGRLWCYPDLYLLPTVFMCVDIKALTRDESNLADIWLRINLWIMQLDRGAWEEEDKIQQWVLIASCQFVRHVCWADTSLSFFLILSSGKICGISAAVAVRLVHDVGGLLKCSSQLRDVKSCDGVTKKGRSLEKVLLRNSR